MSTQTARPGGTDTARRRTQSLAGALTGVAVVAVLTVVFIVVKHSDGSDKSSPAASAPSAAAQPAPGDSVAAAPPPAQPAPVETPPALTKEPAVHAGKGKISKLVITELIPGKGPAVVKGQTLTANYKLISYKTGKLLDSSWKKGQPFSTPIGVGQVIKGWDESIPGQKVGSRLQIDVPAALAYGPQQGDLRFVVDLLAAQ